MDYLTATDNFLFILINHLPHPAAANLIALTVSGVGAFGIIWLILSVFYFIHEEKRDHLFFLPIVSAIALSYAAAELVLKPVFARPRPDALVDAVIVESVNRGYSFPSGHTAVAFAGAAVLSVYEKKYRPYLYALAVLIALSRIYLGKHFPTDIIMGAFIGFMFGKLSLVIHHPIIRRSLKQRSVSHKSVLKHG
jgi:undecaprenyl-diphosphatase